MVGDKTKPRRNRVKLKTQLSPRPKHCQFGSDWFEAENVVLSLSNVLYCWISDGNADEAEVRPNLGISNQLVYGKIE